MVSRSIGASAALASPIRAAWDWGPLRHGPLGLFLLVILMSAEVFGASGSGAQPFSFLPTSEVFAEPFGLVMSCPAHKHGTFKEAVEKLKNLVSERSGRISAGWVCKQEQQNTLEVCAPLVDRVVINPFVDGSDDAVDETAVVWPGCDHPVLNRLREIRRGAGRKELYACIDAKGEPLIFHKRRASFEEIEWMTLAAIGADVQGIVWRNRPERSMGQRLRYLEQRVLQHADDLGAARPVFWVERSQGVFLSALRSEERLFVVLLSPQYLAGYGQRKEIPLPIEPPETRCEVEFSAREGVEIMSGSTVSGVSIPLERQNGSTIIKWQFSGPGELLVLDIETASSNVVGDQGRNEGTNQE